MTDQDVFDFCQRAREAGYAITAFTPSELRGADVRQVVDAMVEGGNDQIDYLASKDADECPAGGKHNWQYQTSWERGPGRPSPSGRYCTECDTYAEPDQEPF